MNRRRRRFCVRCKYIISVKGSEGSMLVSAHVSTVYAVSYRLHFQPNLTSPKPCKTQPRRNVKSKIENLSPGWLYNLETVSS
jgi:hypothetical protein